MPNKKIEILVIEDDEFVIHRSVSTVDEEVNPFNVAIQAMVNGLTGQQLKPVVRIKDTPASTDKFAQAVPNYKAPESVEFHPDLVKQGVAPKTIKPVVENGIPTVKLDMKSILKGAK